MPLISYNHSWLAVPKWNLISGRMTPTSSFSRNVRKIALVGLTLYSVSVGPANPAKAETRCIDLFASRGAVTFTGKLEPILRYASTTEQGDAWKSETEPVLMLKLASVQCADDRMFINSDTKFNRVQVDSESIRILRLLFHMVNQDVTVSGEGSGAFNANHQAAFVINVTRVSPARR